MRRQSPFRRVWWRPGAGGFLALVLATAAPVAAGGQTTVIAPEGSVIVEGLGDGAYLGVQLEEGEEGSRRGARITRVVEDSPADEAGLRVGDLVVEFGGDSIRGPDGLTRKIHAREPGDQVKLRVLRDGRERTVQVELGEREIVWNRGYNVFVPEAPEGKDWQEWAEKWSEWGEKWGEQWGEEWGRDLGERMERLGEQLGGLFVCEDDDCSFNVVPPGDFSLDCDGDDCSFTPLNRWRSFQLRAERPKLGVQLVEVTPELRRHLGGTDEVGVLVSKIVSGSAAERAGIQVGDLIVEVGGHSIASTGELRHALEDKHGETFEVDVIRDGRRRSIAVTIPKPDDDVPTGPRARQIGPGSAGGLDRARRLARQARAEARTTVADARSLAREARRLAQRDRNRSRRQIRDRVVIRLDAGAV